MVLTNIFFRVDLAMKHPSCRDVNQAHKTSARAMLGFDFDPASLTSGYCSDQQKKSLPAEMLNFAMEHPAKYEHKKSI